MTGRWQGYVRNRNLSSLEVAWLAGHSLLGFHLHTRCISHDVEDINYIDNITVDDGRYLICCWLFTMIHILTTLLLMMDIGHWQDLPEPGWTAVLAQSMCKLPPWRWSVEYLNMHQDLNTYQDLNICLKSFIKFHDVDLAGRGWYERKRTKRTVAFSAWAGLRPTSFVCGAAAV